MTGMVTVAVAGDVAEAQEIRSVLERAGIDTELEGAETEARRPAPRRAHAACSCATCTPRRCSRRSPTRTQEELDELP